MRPEPAAGSLERSKPLYRDDENATGLKKAGKMIPRVAYEGQLKSLNE